MANRDRMDLNEHFAPNWWYGDGFSHTCYPDAGWATCTSSHTGDIAATSGPDGIEITVKVHQWHASGNPVDVDLVRLQIRPYRQTP